MTTVEDRIKAWMAPLLMLGLISTASFIWKMQQDRIASLELAAVSTSNTLATITENQRLNTDDRKAFQDNVSNQLGKIDDTLSVLGQNMAALTAIQKSQLRQ